MSEQKREFRSRDRWLVFAFILGPMAALTHLTVSYSLVADACARNSKMLLHVSTLVFLLLSLGAAAIAWRIYMAFVEAEGVLWRERTRWLATVALVMAISSAVVIIAMEIPNLILRSCD